MTEDEIFELLGKIARWKHNNNEYFIGWRNALDIVEIHFREHFRERRGGLTGKLNRFIATLTDKEKERFSELMPASIANPNGWQNNG